jgi:uncharacterized membrane protein YfcA
MDIAVLLTLVFGLVVGTGSSITGGGGLLLTPYLLLIGLPPHTAVTTPKLAGFGLALGAITRFNKSKDIDWKWVKRLLPLSIVAGIIGPQILFRVSGEFVETVVVVAMLALAPLVLFGSVGLSEKLRGRFHRGVGYGLYLIVSSAKAAFGSGIGALLMYVMMGPLGMTAIRANAAKRVVGLGILVPSFLQFAIAGLIDWRHGTAMFIGNIAGGWIGANIAVKKGNLFVRTAFAIAAIAGAISILVT